MSNSLSLSCFFPRAPTAATEVANSASAARLRDWANDFPPRFCRALRSSSARRRSSLRRYATDSFFRVATANSYSASYASNPVVVAQVSRNSTPCSRLPPSSRPPESAARSHSSPQSPATEEENPLKPPKPASSNSPREAVVAARVCVPVARERDECLLFCALI